MADADEGPTTDWQSVHDAMLQAAADLQQRFGDREPTEDEVRAYLRERLLAQGRTPQEVDDFLADL